MYGHKRTHNRNYKIDICLASFDDTFVHSYTFVDKNELIYHQETSMLRSLSTDTITHTYTTTNQTNEQTTLLEWCRGQDSANCNVFISSLFYDIGCRLYNEHGSNNSSTETTRHLQPIHQTNNDRDEQGITSVGSEFNS